jgi:hypothetical protein
VARYGLKKGPAVDSMVAMSTDYGCSRATTEGFRSIENKKFPTMTNKNKPRSDLRDAKQ